MECPLYDDATLAILWIGVILSDLKMKKVFEGKYYTKYWTAEKRLYNDENKNDQRIFREGLHLLRFLGFYVLIINELHRV